MICIGNGGQLEDGQRVILKPTTFPYAFKNLSSIYYLHFTIYSRRGFSSYNALTFAVAENLTNIGFDLSAESSGSSYSYGTIYYLTLGMWK